jgi:LysR family transcriptional regulator, hca operon transcriptional activator
VAILPSDHRLARRKSVKPQDLAREIFISPARLAPVLSAVINEYAAKIGISFKQKYDAETVSGGMSWHQPAAWLFSRSTSKTF